MRAGSGTDPAAPETKLRLPNEVLVLVGASFVIAVGFGILAPALPTFAASFDVGITAASFVISAFAFMRLAFAPVSGRLVTAFGERPVYVWGLLIVALSTGACAFAANYWQLLVFRALGGIGSTMFTVSAVALLIRLSPPPMRGRASGLWATGFLLGNIAGPLFGGGLIAVSLRTPFVVYAVLLVVAALITWLFLRRSTLADPERSADVAVVTVGQALRHPTYRSALGSSFANGWAVFGVRVSLVPLFVVEVLHRSPSVAGLSLAAFAVGNTMVLILSGRMADVIGRKPLVLAGLLITAGGTIWLGYTSALPVFLLASLIAGLGSGVLYPPMNAAVADVVGSRGRSGSVLAAFQMSADIGAIVGPLATGLIADNASYQAAFVATGSVSLLAALAWLPAPETLPRTAAAGPVPAPVTDAADGIAARPADGQLPAEPTAGRVSTGPADGRVSVGRAAERASAGPAAGRISASPAAECGILDEGPEVPRGERVSGHPRQPDA
jgi:MFS family permease